MDFWKVLKIIGFILMIIGSIIFLLDVYGYVSGNLEIKNDKSIEVSATMNYSELEYIKITYKKRAYRWITEVSYEYEGVNYTSEKRARFAFLEDNSPITIYVDAENPQFYFYERDVTIYSFLSVIYPILGTGLFFIAKRNEMY